ncbi:ABC transporter ATP-binding protein [Brevibacterium album]|uniref:ABC transporter ATP-binding protein n=1 Tax=Brevibacterium album TaxID=417948 RepID=UPI0004201FB7|nr:ABC transporter ATP-binding protein [Brevibacterium album]
MALLEIRDLRISFMRRGRPPVRAVDGLDLDVDGGQTVGLVGESGCGKSITSLSVLGLLPKRGVEVSGSIRYDGIELLSLNDDARRSIRGREISMIFQDPMTSLNPVVRIGVQITEPLRRHKGMTKGAAMDAAERLLRRVGIPAPRQRLGEFPHQLSGGMRQRVLIAIALACGPRMLIADEPTTALDVTVQAQILDLLKEQVVESGTALMMITHDMGVVAELCDHVTVMYAGRAVEAGNVRDLFAHPTHRYTAGLLAAMPRLETPRDAPLNPIPGSADQKLPWDDGCAFMPRCAAATAACGRGLPPMQSTGWNAVGGGLDEEHLHRCLNPAPALAKKAMTP